MAWNAANPAGNQKIRLSDEEIRANWAALEAALSSNLCMGLVTGGTIKMIFYADTAPTGWTLQNTLDDKLLFVTKGSAAGGETGGGAHSSGSWTISGLTKDAHTHAFTQPTAHAITQPAFTGPSHTHTGPSHTHNQNVGSGETKAPLANIYTTDIANATIWTSQSGGGTSYPVKTGVQAGGVGPTSASGTGACTRSQDVALSNNHAGGAVGAQSDNAISSAGTWRPAAYCVIICSRD